MEQSGAQPPGDALEYMEMYGDPETDTGRELQDRMDAAAARWSATATVH